MPFLIRHDDPAALGALAIDAGRLEGGLAVDRERDALAGRASLSAPSLVDVPSPTRSDLRGLVGRYAEALRPAPDRDRFLERGGRTDRSLARDRFEFEAERSVARDEQRAAAEARRLQDQAARDAARADAEERRTQDRAARDEANRADRDARDARREEERDRRFREQQDEINQRRESDLALRERDEARAARQRQERAEAEKVAVYATPPESLLAIIASDPLGKGRDALMAMLHPSATPEEIRTKADELERVGVDPNMTAALRKNADRRAGERDVRAKAEREALIRKGDFVQKFIGEQAPVIYGGDTDRARAEALRRAGMTVEEYEAYLDEMERQLGLAPANTPNPAPSGAAPPSAGGGLWQQFMRGMRIF